MGGETKATLLIVDGEPGILNALRRQLAEEPYGLLLTDDAGQALRWLREGRVGAVLCDGRMTGPEGRSLLAWAAELAPGATRIVLGGAGDARAVEGGEACCALDKPWDETTLLGRLREAMGLVVGRGCQGG